VFRINQPLEEANHACYIVRDANNFRLAYVYFESEPGRRAAARLMTEDDARRVAAGIAKLQELLKPLVDNSTQKPSEHKAV
jgi:hypothetical protein